MRQFAVVTSCHAPAFREYGQAMLESWRRHWPAEVQLLFYTEGFSLPATSDARVIERDLLASCPQLVAFKQRHRTSPRANGRIWRPLKLKLGGLKLPLPIPVRQHRYRWDAVRFAHKSFALFHAAANTDADVLIWIDADTLFFADVDLPTLESFAPPEAIAGYLAREGSHSETGFVSYNLRQPGTRTLLSEFEQLYTDDTIFDEREWHDAYLFDVLRRRAEQRGERAYDIAQGIGVRASHVLINSPLGAFMDHMKGGRKARGASSPKDLVAARSEAYWKRR